MTAQKVDTLNMKIYFYSYLASSGLCSAETLKQIFGVEIKDLEKATKLGKVWNFNFKGSTVKIMVA